MSQPKCFLNLEKIVNAVRKKINITYPGGMTPMTADSLPKATEAS